MVEVGEAATVKRVVRDPKVFFPPQGVLSLTAFSQNRCCMFNQVLPPLLPTCLLAYCTSFHPPPSLHDSFSSILLQPPPPPPYSRPPCFISLHQLSSTLPQDPPPLRLPSLPFIIKNSVDEREIQVEAKNSTWKNDKSPNVHTEVHVMDFSLSSGQDSTGSSLLV